MMSDRGLACSWKGVLSVMKSNSPLCELIDNHKIIIMIGAGGVGKTTSAMAFAVLAAQQGRKVGLLSIDPAKRLAKAIGLELGAELHQLDFSDLEVAGSVKAAMLDQKSVFDQMVRRFARSEKSQNRIFSNRLYQEVSKNLGGPLEYMALAKLQQMADSQEYDLIILDTPPDTHALDFLTRPNILAGFMEQKVITWLIKPFILAQKLKIGKIFSFGEKIMGGIAAVTGVAMLQSLAEFIVLMEDVIKGFHQSGQRVSQLLKDSETAFVVVSNPAMGSILSSEKLVEVLGNEGFPLKMILINRFLREEIVSSLEALKSGDFEIEETLKNQFSLIARKHQASRALVDRLISSARDAYDRLPVVVVEEQDKMVHSLAALWHFSRILEYAKQYKD